MLLMALIAEHSSSSTPKGRMNLARSIRRAVMAGSVLVGREIVEL